MRERGPLALSVADVVAFDPDTVGRLPLERLYDFPAGADRLVSRSKGIEHVWVGGEATRRAGEDLAGRSPGLVLRPRTVDSGRSDTAS